MASLALSKFLIAIRYAQFGRIAYLRTAGLVRAQKSTDDILIYASQALPQAYKIQISHAYAQRTDACDLFFRILLLSNVVDSEVIPNKANACYFFLKMVVRLRRGLQLVGKDTTKREEYKINSDLFSFQAKKVFRKTFVYLIENH